MRSLFFLIAIFFLWHDVLPAQEIINDSTAVSEPDTLRSDLFFTNPNVASDRIIVEEEESAKDKKPHSPRTAIILSAVLPGLGQAYNKKYWKIPIVYAGLGVGVYFLQDNIREVKTFKQHYRNATDDDPNTINTSGFNQAGLQEKINQHKKWRDYSYLGLAAVYLLNLLDANVDAHLFNFDVSEDLSMSVTPSLLYTGKPTPGITLCLKL